MWESTLLVERYELHREVMESIMIDAKYQVFSAVIKGSDLPYDSSKNRLRHSFREFDSPEGLKAILERFPEIFAAFLNIESFSSSTKDADRGNLFNEYFPRIVVPTLTKIVLTSALPEQEVRERYALAFGNVRTSYLRKPFSGTELLASLK
ncbi:MAG: hypothetical protein V2A62_01720 [Candidatus Woesearchaeota archaeon]